MAESDKFTSHFSSFDRQYLESPDLLLQFYAERNYLPNVLLLIKTDQIETCSLKRQKYEVKEQIRENEQNLSPSLPQGEDGNAANWNVEPIVQLSDYDRQPLPAISKFSNYQLPRRNLEELGRQVTSQLIDMTCIICSIGSYDDFIGHANNLCIYLTSAVVYRHFNTKKTQFIVKTLDNCKEMLNAAKNSEKVKIGEQQLAGDDTLANYKSLQKYYTQNIEELKANFFDASFEQSCLAIKQDLREIERINKRRQSLAIRKLSPLLTSATLKYQYRKCSSSTNRPDNMKSIDDFHLTPEVSSPLLVIISELL
ncbi:MAG: hypothetical protein MHMPM18_002291 [Marteilia pararefringens]